MLYFLLIGATLGLEACVPSCTDTERQSMTLAEITEQYQGKDAGLLNIHFYDDANLDELDVLATQAVVLVAVEGKLSGTFVSKVSTAIQIGSLGKSSSIKDLSVEMVYNMNNTESEPPITINQPIKKLSIDFGDLNKKDEYIPCYAAPEEIKELSFKSKTLGFIHKNPKKVKVDAPDPLLSGLYIFSYQQVEGGDSGSSGDGPNVGLIVGVVVAVVVVIVVVVVVVVLVLRKKKSKDSGSNK